VEVGGALAKIVRYVSEERASYGLIEGDTVYELVGDPYGDFVRGSLATRLDDIQLLSPCQPTKIVGVGLNYRAVLEAREGITMEVPILFFKPPSSVIGSGETIVLPGMSKKVFFEAELAVVMGGRAKRISASEAADHIFGYTCANDVSAMDLSKADLTVLRAKSFDTFCPLGPCIATELEMSELVVRARLNGELRQEGSTEDMIFPIAELVAFISQVMTLEPGDVILTGTTLGAGILAPGDVIEVEIDGIGTLSNDVLAEDRD
jgi:2-keto-4-pentenoate hydratase/2-oxohepta-3-ene-1,7-dioic acid hydratase in catechol pathway